MAASNTDKLIKAAVDWTGAIGGAGVSDAVVTTIPLVSTTGLPTDTAVDITIDRVDSNGSITNSKKEVVRGVVSGSNVITCVRGVEGTAQAHSAGAVVEIMLTADMWNRKIDAFLLQHNQDGSHQSTVNLPAGMARQAIINGNFDIWQRGTSVALADVTTQWLADRWLDYIDKNGGTLPTLTRSQQLLTPGDIPGAKFFTRLATNGPGTSLGVNSRGEYSQKIENGTSKLCGAGKKVTKSFWARSSIANKRICPVWRQHYGSGGSPTAEEYVLGTPITLTSTWTKYTVTFTTNTLVGKTFGTNGDDYATFALHYMWGATFGNTYVSTGVSAESFVGAGNIDFAQVQLCSDDVALPFQPKSPDEELRACQRYCQRYDSLNNTTASFGVGYSFSTTLAIIHIYFLVKMKSLPTLISVTASNFSVSKAGGGGPVCTTVTINQGEAHGVDLGCAVASGLTTGDAVMLNANATTSALLIFESE